MARYILIFLVLIACFKSQASSCCGQSPASFPVLYQQQKYSLSPSVSYLQSQGRVQSGSEYYIWPSDKKRTVSIIGMNAAATLTERQQLFLSAGYLSASYEEQSVQGTSANFSDTLVGHSYEIVSEYVYSPWKPVVYLSTFVNVPTGHSIYDENKLSEGADVTGHNQWGLGIGLSARKVFFPWTILAQAKILRLLEKDFSTTKVSGFYDSSVALFVTRATSLWDISATAGLTLVTLSPRTVSAIRQKSDSSNVNTVIFSIQKPITDEWSVSLAYSDQSLVGRPQNTLINKSYTLNVNYNFF